MAEVIRMPRLSDTMEEGNIVEWHKQEGDEIEPGDVLAEVETDKATMEIENYDKEGILLHIEAKEGAVPVNAVIAVVGEEGEDYESVLQDALSEDNSSGASESEEKEQDSAEDSEKEETSDDQTETSTEEKSETDDTTTSKSSDDDKRIKASPLAKKIAEEKGINISEIEGSGDGGRIIKRDVESYEKTDEKKSGSASKQTEQIQSYEEVEVSQMRKTIARRLAESKFNAPHFYLTMNINMDKSVEFRKTVNESLEEGKVSFNDLVVKAAAAALKKHPQVNSSWLGDKIRINNDINIGVAVAVEEGLLVPVLRNTDGMSLTQINSSVKELAGKAQEKKLSTEEMQGNTFTISNLGMFGIEEFTAIINPPDACILAVGGITKKPVVINDEVKVASMMKVTLSCDHRVVDGATGAEFLQTFKSMLENPMNILV